MKILLVVPSTTDWARRLTADYVSALSLPGTEIEVASIEAGPTSIETFCDEAHAAPEVVKVIRQRSQGADAIVVNCFADPGVRAAREIVNVPVIGAGEAAYALATLLADRFGVVSLLTNGVASTLLQVRSLGLQERLAGVAAIDVPVLEMESDAEATVGQALEAAKKLISEHGAEAVVLGCTGMARLAEALAARLPVPVVEPCAAALQVARSLVDLGLSHAHTGLYLRGPAEPGGGQ
jgi:allantoin racemase